MANFNRIETKTAKNGNIIVKLDGERAKFAQAESAIRQTSIYGGEVELIAERNDGSLICDCYRGGYNADKSEYIFTDGNGNEYIFIWVDLALKEFARGNFGEVITVKAAEVNTTEETTEAEVKTYEPQTAWQNPHNYETVGDTSDRAVESFNARTCAVRKADFIIEKLNGNYSTVINGEYVNFKNHSIVYIDAQHKLGLQFTRKNGKKIFTQGCVMPGKMHFVPDSQKQIAAAKVAELYMKRQAAIKQNKPFAEILNAYKDNSKGFFKAWVTVTFADDREHNAIANFDNFNDAKAYVDEARKIFAGLATTATITENVQGGHYYYILKEDGSETYDIPDTSFFSKTETEAAVEDLNPEIVFKAVNTIAGEVTHTTSQERKEMWFSFGRRISQARAAELLAKCGFRSIEEFLAAEKIAEEYKEDVVFPQFCACRNETQIELPKGTVEGTNTETFEQKRDRLQAEVNETFSYLHFSDDSKVADKIHNRIMKLICTGKGDSDERKSLEAELEPINKRLGAAEHKYEALTNELATVIAIIAEAEAALEIAVVDMDDAIAVEIYNAEFAALKSLTPEQLTNEFIRANINEDTRRLAILNDFIEFNKKKDAELFPNDHAWSDDKEETEAEETPSIGADKPTDNEAIEIQIGQEFMIYDNGVLLGIASEKYGAILEFKGGEIIYKINPLTLDKKRFDFTDVDRVDEYDFWDILKERGAIFAEGDKPTEHDDKPGTTAGPAPAEKSDYEISQELDAALVKVTCHANYMDVTLQNGQKIVTRFGGLHVAPAWNHDKGFIFVNFDDTLAYYDTPEQVKTVINLLRDNIRQSGEEFTFPKVEDLTPSAAAGKEAIASDVEATIQCVCTYYEMQRGLIKKTLKQLAKAAGVDLASISYTVYFDSNKNSDTGVRIKGTPVSIEKFKYLLGDRLLTDSEHDFKELIA